MYTTQLGTASHRGAVQLIYVGLPIVEDPARFHKPFIGSVMTAGSTQVGVDLSPLAALQCSHQHARSGVQRLSVKFED